MLKILCKACNTELTSHPTKAHSCGCSNMTMILNDRISANDLTLVQIISNIKNQKPTDSVLSAEDIAFQEERRKRKVRKLEFEVR
jgi:hypothetical protein